MKHVGRLLASSLILISGIQYSDTYSAVRIPEWTHNLLVDAKVTGNLQSYSKGLRGAPDHVIYDLRQRRFVKSSQWHEYGVGFGQDLGAIREGRAAWWMAQWPQPIEANLIVLSGVYENQPQPQTAWKIELRSGGKWSTHARGIGGWYDRGRYVWGGPATKPILFDAIRVSVFSKDGRTPLKSVHFRGEERISWIVACCPPIDAEMQLPRWPVRAAVPVQFDATALLGKIQSWSWDFGDGEKASGKSVTHAFDSAGTFEVGLEFSDGKNTAKLRRTITVVPPVEARITPLAAPVIVGKPVDFAADESIGRITNYKWDFGDD
ncbi:MAG: PKD domain-containing protein, partial [Phycisphaerales bacterium]